MSTARNGTSPCPCGFFIILPARNTESAQRSATPPCTCDFSTPGRPSSVTTIFGNLFLSRLPYHPAPFATGFQVFMSRGRRVSSRGTTETNWTGRRGAQDDRRRPTMPLPTVFVPFRATRRFGRA